MTEKEILKRKIQLKRQYLKLIAADHRVIIYKLKAQRKDLIYKLTLVELKDTLEAQIKDKVDPELSQKLDCINYLLENWE